VSELARYNRIITVIALVFQSVLNGELLNVH
jgi:hypothetical protein